LFFPSLERVDTKAMGRGTMDPIMSSWI